MVYLKSFLVIVPLNFVGNFQFKRRCLFLGHFIKLTVSRRLFPVLSKERKIVVNIHDLRTVDSLESIQVTKQETLTVKVEFTE